MDVGVSVLEFKLLRVENQRLFLDRVHLDGRGTPERSLRGLEMCCLRNE